MKSRATILVTALLIGLGFSAPTLAQKPGDVNPSLPDAAPLGSSGSTFDPSLYGTVMVYLRTEDGQIMPQKLTATLVIVPVEGGAPLRIVPQLMGDGWLFSGVGIGRDYNVQVVATGYEPAQDRVRLADKPGAAASVIVFMHPIDQELTFHPPTGRFVLAPRAEKEIQHALLDLQSGKVPSAQKHAQVALQVSPENPYVQYVMGLTYLLVNRDKEAKAYLEKSVSIDPRQPLSLRALGTVRYRLGDNAGAAEALSKAVQLDDSSWKAEWLLAASYQAEKKYAEARDHAEQAIKIGKNKADQVQLVLGMAFADLGERQKAAELFDKFVAEFPNDPNAANAVKWAKMMREPAKAAPISANLSTSIQPPIEVPPRPDWAPPDVDKAKPFVVSEAVCPLPEILKTAGATAEQLISNLQEFTATEDFQNIELKHGQQPEKPADHNFKYLVFIEQVSPQAFDVKESRSDGKEEVPLPVPIQDIGVPAIALAFHPILQPDFDWKCEGLGTWGNQPAWVIHFEQKPKEPNVLAWFTTPTTSYSLPLKGRAWVSERGGQVLHLDTDLVSAVDPIDLKREHFSIDYKQVSFAAHKVDLWLPENVDTYYQYRGHFLHYYHHFSDYKLFWVGASQKIGDPKGASQQPEKEP